MTGTQFPSDPDFAMCYAECMADLIADRALSPDQMRKVLQGMLAERLGPVEVAAFLTALRMRGETASDLEVAARLLREKMVPLPLDNAEILDTCGTGGDGSNTFNISTATALVVAACGVRVVKHGNRAVSSLSGSVDALELLGVRVAPSPELAAQCLKEVGIAFCFAPHFHPAMRVLADIRRRLRFRTLFNCLGPLLNPAKASYQLLGVGQREMIEPMSQALARLGIRRAFLVRSHDGLDEVSLSSPTLVTDVHGEAIRTMEWKHEDFGLPACSLKDLHASNPQESVARIREVLNAEEGPALHIVLANAAAALLVVGKVQELKQGVQVARAAVHEGKARDVLDRLRALAHEQSNT